VSWSKTDAFFKVGSWVGSAAIFVRGRLARPLREVCDRRHPKGVEVACGDPHALLTLRPTTCASSSHISGISLARIQVLPIPRFPLVLFGFNLNSDDVHDLLQLYHCIQHDWCPSSCWLATVALPGHWRHSFPHHTHSHGSFLGNQFHGAVCWRLRRNWRWYLVSGASWWAHESEARVTPSLCLADVAWGWWSSVVDCLRTRKFVFVLFLDLYTVESN
jgi:hypothetical protein